MIYRAKRQPRAGTILPLVAVCLITLLGFVALAIDIGVMQVARTQCQNAADTAAIAGARSLTGDSTSNYNYAGALPAAQSAADGNSVLGQALAGSQAQIAIGKYRYDSTQNQFIIDFDPNNNYPQDAWSLVQSTVTASHTSYFAPILGMRLGGGTDPGAAGLSSLNVSATSTAAHRPVDVAIIIDFSGSMRLGSLLGAPVDNATGIVPRTQSMNPETVVPTWGQYASAQSNNNVQWRGWSGTSVPTLTAPTGELIDQCNITTATGGGPAIVNDFFQDTTAFGATTPAFSSVANASGDMPLYKGGGTAYAYNLNEVLSRSGGSSSTTPSSAAPFIDNTSSGSTTAGYAATFKGYTLGPSYWGKTFFIWPPDPRGPSAPANTQNNGAKDWRQRFFQMIYLGTRTTSSSPRLCRSATAGRSTTSTAWPCWRRPRPRMPPPWWGRWRPCKTTA